MEFELQAESLTLPDSYIEPGEPNQNAYIERFNRELLSNTTFDNNSTVPAHEQVDCADWNTVAFFEAAEVPDVTRCLQLGADLEARGENGLNPLHWATQFGTAEAVTALVEARADVDARDEDGLTPLHWTAMVGCAEVVMALLV